MGIGLDEHWVIHTYVMLDGYRARQSLVGLSAHCANPYIPQELRDLETYVLTGVNAYLSINTHE